MSARAKMRKTKGVVVDGRVRDLAEHRSMDFPVSWGWANNVAQSLTIWLK